MQTMTIKHGIPTANPMNSASSFSVKQNVDENHLTEPTQSRVHTGVGSFDARVIYSLLDSSEQN